VYDEIAQGSDYIQVGKRQVNARSYVADFNFKGADQQKRVKDLSGGERNRVHLAKLLRSGGNVLLLDEPTNDLDVDTLRALEEALLGFAGCVVVISHDRWFSTVSPPTFWLSRATAKRCGSRATTRTTKPTAPAPGRRRRSAAPESGTAS